MPPDIGDVRLAVPDGGLARRAVPGRWRVCLDRLFRARPGAAGDASRAGADDSRRGDARLAPGPRTSSAHRRSGHGIGASPDPVRRLPAQRPCFVNGRSRHTDRRHGPRRDRQRGNAKRDGSGRHVGAVRRGSRGIVAGYARAPARCLRPKRSARSKPVQRRPSRTSSSRRNTSACSASTSYAAAASCRPNAARARRSWSCPRASRGSCGRTAMPSVRSCISRPIRTRRRDASMSRHCRAHIHRRRSRTRRAGFPVRRLQGSRRLRADQRRGCRNVADRARPRRSRAGAPRAARSGSRPSIRAWGRSSR